MAKQIDIQEIIKAFWDEVPDDATWEDLNKGMDINFTYKSRTYTINTRLGNRYSMNIEDIKIGLNKKLLML